MGRFNARSFEKYYSNITPIANKKTNKFSEFMFPTLGRKQIEKGFAFCTSAFFKVKYKKIKKKKIRGT